MLAFNGVSKQFQGTTRESRAFLSGNPSTRIVKHHCLCHTTHRCVLLTQAVTKPSHIRWEAGSQSLMYPGSQRFMCSLKTRQWEVKCRLMQFLPKWHFWSSALIAKLCHLTLHYPESSSRSSRSFVQPLCIFSFVTYKVKSVVLVWAMLRVVRHLRLSCLWRFMYTALQYISLPLD